MDIFQLTPKGKLWHGKNARKLFLSIQNGIQRVKNEASLLLQECFPNTSKQLLSDWMRVCNAKSLNGILSTLAATGGNTEAFFESIAKQFDSQCQILKNNPGNQFVAGVSSAGMSLGEVSIPKFCVVFNFSVVGPINEAEEILNKLKPAHVRFIYIYKQSQTDAFVAGSSCAGDALNYYKEISYA